MPLLAGKVGALTCASHTICQRQIVIRGTLCSSRDLCENLIKNPYVGSMSLESLIAHTVSIVYTRTPFYKPGAPPEEDLLFLTGVSHWCVIMDRPSGCKKNPQTLTYADGRGT